jgi:hypothetical protein
VGGERERKRPRRYNLYVPFKKAVRNTPPTTLNHPLLFSHEDSQSIMADAESSNALVSTADTTSNDGPIKISAWGQYSTDGKMQYCLRSDPKGPIRKPLDPSG